MTADIAMVSLFTFCTYDMQQIYILFAYDMSNSSTTVTIVRLDENGEPLSKNALKKLLKKEAADKKKAEKAAARVSS